MSEYDITKGRTYLYFNEPPAYAFGHGLSFIHFKYDQLQLSAPSLKADDPIAVKLNVTNDGKVDGTELIQDYVRAQKATVPMPLRQPWAFQRVHLAHGQSQWVTLTLDTSHLVTGTRRSKGFSSNLVRSIFRSGQPPTTYA